jgi:hypothetical protein
MTTLNAGVSLAAGLALTDLGINDLWLLYFALGGSHPRPELQKYLSGAGRWSAHEHDVAAHALNEYFVDHGLDHLVAYATDL